MSQPAEQVSTKRAIFNEEDLKNFWASKAYKDLTEFIAMLGESVTGKANDFECPASPIVEKILNMLETMDGWIKDIPPIQQPMRYGNKAYRIWNDRLVNNSESLCRDLLPDDKKDLALELSSYLNDSFGNQTRIDYGTGHECTFVLWLCCLYLINVITKDDFINVVIKVFVRYIKLCRNLQTTYWLEPAGSHGVWSLDDYQMLVFYFGAAQLVGHKHIKPKSIDNSDILMGFSDKYLYLAAISFIRKVKTGELYENSPILYNVSGVPKWEKVMSGMYKMFIEEVLHKFPVIQHFRFGTIFKCEWTPSEDPSTKEYGRVAPPTEAEIKGEISNDGSSSSNNKSTNIKLPPVVHKPNAVLVAEKEKKEEEEKLKKKKEEEEKEKEKEKPKEEDDNKPKKEEDKK